MKKGKKYVLSIISMLLAISLLFSSCRKAAGDDAVYQIPEENKLIVYTSHKEEVYAPIIKEFEERTGIFVEVKQGGTLELFDEIVESGGKTSCDVMFGGGLENYVAYEEYLEAYQVEDVERLEERYRCKEDKWTPFSILPIVFVYNNKLVYSAAAPRTWEELQTNRWKGKVAFADPSESGSSYTALCTMIQALGSDEDTVIKKFSEVLDGHIIDGSGAVLDEVNNGTRLVGVTLEETARKRIAQGADLSMVYPVEGTSAIPDGVAIIKGTTHLENAQKFVEFTVSEDVQRLLVDEMYRKSIRTDIEEKADDTEDQIKLIDYDIVWAAEERDTILEKWAALQEE